MELVFLPAYSPILNAIEEFWSVCVAKVKRSNLTRKEQLTPRIIETTAKITLESYRGFSYTVKFGTGIFLEYENFF